MPATVSHALSATTPDDPSFEIRPSHWNSSHLMTLNAVGSEISSAFGNAGGVTFGYDGTNVTASAPAAAASPINFSAGTTSSNIGSVVFSNSNGISFGLNGSTITGTVATNYQAPGNYLTTAALSGDTTKYVQNWKLSGNTSGTTSSAQGTDLWLAGGNGVTLSGSSNTISFSVATNYQSQGAYLTTADLSANSSNYFRNWKLTGNTSGTTSSQQGTDFWLAGGNGVTISGSSNTLSFSVATNYQSQAAYLTTADLSQNSSKYMQNWKITGNTSGTTSSAEGTDLWLAGGNGVTLSGSSNTISFSVANDVTYIGGLSNSQTLYTSGTVILSEGGGAITIASAAAQHFNFSVPQTSSIVGTSGISISSAGSTISVFPKALSAWEPVPVMTGTGTSSHAPASFWFSKMNLDWPVAVSYANVLKSLNVSAPGMSSQNSSATNKFSYSHGLTLFTRQDFAGNSSNMSQWTTASFGMTGTLSQSSSSASVALSWVTNSTGGTTSFSTTSGSNNWTNFFTGLQMFRIPLVTTLTPGEYFVGQGQSSTTATVGSNFTLLSVSNFHIVPQSITLATVTSSGSFAFSAPEGQGIGVASAVTTNNTMALSVVSAATQNWWYMNFSNA